MVIRYHVHRTLHSTMFLLIQAEQRLKEIEKKFFTFHNVSINTNTPKNLEVLDMLFTFHNVSINTEGGKMNLTEIFFFTFHNVSINT